jgi:hypothetical protein
MGGEPVGKDVSADQLSKSEKAELSECCETIKNGFASSWKTADALRRVRDKRLYRETHKTFESWCRAVWKYGRAYVNRRIASLELATDGAIDTELLTEGALRPLVVADIPESAKLKIATELAKDGPFTETQSKKAVKTYKQRRDTIKMNQVRKLPDTVRFITADIRQAEPGKIDCIITDPPYPSEYKECFSWLSEFANRFLPEGGSCIVMTGQFHLQEYLERLSEKLSYWWTCCYLTPGQKTPIKARRIDTAWKPLLWFAKGKPNLPIPDDVFVSPKPDKNHHEWGQSVQGMRAIVERFSKPGDVVCDPFCGAGTTGVAAFLAGRRFVGIDVEENEIEKTKARIADAKA